MHSNSLFAVAEVLLIMWTEIRK